MAKKAKSQTEKPVPSDELEALEGSELASAKAEPSAAPVAEAEAAADAETEVPEPLPDDPEALKSLVQKQQAKAEEYLDRWRRARADFANFRKRNDREREEVVQFANSVLVNKILPILDDFERAAATLPSNLSHLTWVDGVFLIHRKLEWTLQAEGLEPIEAVGKAFDPMVHEAVAYEPSDDHEEGTVLAELQRGYTLHDRVIRPALVKVARGAAQSRETGENETTQQPEKSEGSPQSK